MANHLEDFWRIGKYLDEFSHEHTIKRNSIVKKFNHQLPHDIKRGQANQSPTIIVKALGKDHTTSSFQSSEVKVGAVNHIYITKNLHKW